MNHGGNWDEGMALKNKEVIFNLPGDYDARALQVLWYWVWEHEGWHEYTYWGWFGI